MKVYTGDEYGIIRGKHIKNINKHLEINFIMNKEPRKYRNPNRDNFKTLKPEEMQEEDKVAIESFGVMDKLKAVQKLLFSYDDYCIDDQEPKRLVYNYQFVNFQIISATANGDIDFVSFNNKKVVNTIENINHVKGSKYLGLENKQE